MGSKRAVAGTAKGVLALPFHIGRLGAMVNSV
jgi:hypothetical protein